MSSDEDDYMSDKVLNVCDDIRPGLLRSRQSQRDHEAYKKKISTKPKKLPELEKEKRTAGLTSVIDSSNKGFQMLQKMGYKSGSGLGKSSDARTEPIPVVLKTNTSGLGRESFIAEKIQFKKQVLHKQQKQNMDEFKHSVRQKQVLKYDTYDLYKSQKSCLSLDTKKGLKEPITKWFWPKQNTPNEAKEEDDDEDDDDEEDDEPDVSEKLILITKYLRETYFYCVYCGVEYEDLDDLRKECPGSSREDHD